MEIYIKLLMVALLPVAASVIFCILQTKTKFGRSSSESKWGFWRWQIIVGIVFGVLAIFGTEYGVNIGGATANARDAAPLCAGLLFGAPAGIIAGVIGGVERWFAAYWGAGVYSQIACSVSTVLAGLYAALIRKFILDDKYPSIGLGALSAIVMEVIHLSVLFLTHINDAEKAYEIVKITTFPMLGVNAVAVGLAALGVSIVSKSVTSGQKKKTIAQKVQSAMLVSVVVAYLATTLFVYMLQTSSSLYQADELLNQGIYNVSSEMNTSSADATKVANYHHVGVDGYVLIAGRDGKILSGGDLPSSFTLKDIGIKITDKTPVYTRQSAVCTGRNVKEDCFWMYAIENEYYIVSVVPATQIYETRDASAYVNSYMEVIVFAMFFAIVYLLIKKTVVKNIRTVNADLEKIIGGNLETVVDVRSTDEFDELSNSINSTVTTLKQYIEDAKERINKELEFARNIQNAALPPAFPAFAENKSVEVYAKMNAAKEVGGDFYDTYYVDDHKVAILVADVSGKGIPAAMFMMRAKTMIRSYAEEGKSVEEILALANTHLCEGNDANMFVTAWMGILDTETGHLVFANAGHNCPVIIRADGSSEFIKSPPALVLAALEGVKYKLQEMELGKGDRIFLYTDGVTEANNMEAKLYGEDRLQAFLLKNRSMSGGELLTALKADIEAFAGEAEQFDDITMMSITYLGE